MVLTMTAVHQSISDDQFIEVHLQATSRTFALAIPLLASERRRQIGLSYLMFRVADSVEDAPEGSPAVKKNLLTDLKNCLCISETGHTGNAEFVHHVSTSIDGLWPAESPTNLLLRDFPRLMSLVVALPLPVSQAIRKSLTSTINGMIGFLDSSCDLPNQIQIQTLKDLRFYCYAVAGVVGELLTDLFVFHHPAGQNDHQELRHLSVGFGEFLQLINILKDAGNDADSGRVFIPLEASRESIHELALASRADALAYIRLLEKNDFPADVILYCRFLFLLADGSLKELREGGSGSKLSRAEVMRILSELTSESLALPV